MSVASHVEKSGGGGGEELAQRSIQCRVVADLPDQGQSPTNLRSTECCGQCRPRVASDQIGRERERKRERERERERERLTQFSAEKGGL